MWWDQWDVYRRARTEGNPWLLLPKGFCSFIAPPPVRVAAYVHDIMGDFYARHYPGVFPKLEMEYFTRSLGATIRRSSVIFTNSEFSNKELRDYAQRKGLVQPKVVVAGIGFRRTSTKQAQKEDRVLLFASSMPHKQTKLAVGFLSRWLEKSKFKGVIDCVGVLSPDAHKADGPRWNWMGRISPEQLNERIRRARAVVYASEYEGFGMPPVEAVLEGTCPVFSDILPLCETMGETGCPFSNQAEDSFVAAMNRAVTVSPETLSEWADSLLQRHNWERVAARIVEELSSAKGLRGMAKM